MGSGPSRTKVPASASMWAGLSPASIAIGLLFVVALYANSLSGAFVFDSVVLSSTIRA